MHGPEVQASAGSVVLVLTRSRHLRVSGSSSSCEVNYRGVSFSWLSGPFLPLGTFLTPGLRGPLELAWEDLAMTIRKENPAQRITMIMDSCSLRIVRSTDAGGYSGTEP